MKTNKSINCFNCKYFYITWDRAYPYGCKRLGFKSKYMPSKEVRLSSGVECLYFTNK